MNNDEDLYDVVVEAKSTLGRRARRTEKKRGLIEYYEEDVATTKLQMPMAWEKMRELSRYQHRRNEMEKLFAIHHSLYALPVDIILDIMQKAGMQPMKLPVPNVLFTSVTKDA